MMAQNGGIAHLSNAILMDDRAIVLRGNNGDFFQMYNDYGKKFSPSSSPSPDHLVVRFETFRHQSWVHTTDPREVIRLAKERLASTGNWESIRGALSVQIR